MTLKHLGVKPLDRAICQSDGLGSSYKRIVRSRGCIKHNILSPEFHTICWLHWLGDCYGMTTTYNLLSLFPVYLRGIDVFIEGQRLFRSNLYLCIDLFDVVFSKDIIKKYSSNCFTASAIDLDSHVITAIERLTKIVIVVIRSSPEAFTPCYCNRKVKSDPVSYYITSFYFSVSSFWVTPFIRAYNTKDINILLDIFSYEIRISSYCNQLESKPCRSLLFCNRT